jgi:hypothetical protein
VNEASKQHKGKISASVFVTSSKNFKTFGVFKNLNEEAISFNVWARFNILKTKFNLK